MKNIRLFEAILLLHTRYYNLLKLVDNCDEYGIFASNNFLWYILILVFKILIKKLNYDESVT